MSKQENLQEKLETITEFYASDEKRETIINIYDDLFRNWRIQRADAVFTEKDLEVQRAIILDSQYGFDLWLSFRDFLENLSYNGDTKSLYDLHDFILDANDEITNADTELLSSLIDYINDKID